MKGRLGLPDLARLAVLGPEARRERPDGPALRPGTRLERLVSVGRMLRGETALYVLEQAEIAKLYDTDLEVYTLVKGPPPATARGGRR